ncbi:MAG: c-type cytochrome [Gammaproteobacteria bacterium]
MSTLSFYPEIFRQGTVRTRQQMPPSQSCTETVLAASTPIKFTEYLLCLLLSMGTPFAVGAELPNGPNLGKPAPVELIESWNLEVFPDGQGLPAGRGNALEGRQVYREYCLTCHGAEGQGDSADELAGGRHALTDDPPDKTIGTYWPYATTIFDFTRRSMPLNYPGILTDNQLYAVTAYLLFLNDIIGERDEMNESTLPKVKMPNREGFIDVYKEELKRNATTH